MLGGDETAFVGVRAETLRIPAIAVALGELRELRTGVRGGMARTYAVHRQREYGEADGDDDDRHAEDPDRTGRRIEAERGESGVRRGEDRGEDMGQRVEQ